MSHIEQAHSCITCMMSQLFLRLKFTKHMKYIELLYFLRSIEQNTHTTTIALTYVVV